jgi:hypothetical protein
MEEGSAERADTGTAVRAATGAVQVEAAPVVTSAEMMAAATVAAEMVAVTKA